MFVLKLALVTCAFYLIAAICIEGVLFAVARWRGGYQIFFGNWTAIAVAAAFSGSIWLASFLLAFRIVTPRAWIALVR